jgi:photosystem II stability/assembly factor-like uncharacterized protein
MFCTYVKIIPYHLYHLVTMKKNTFLAIFFAFAAIGYMQLLPNQSASTLQRKKKYPIKKEMDFLNKPNEHFYAQRAYPLSQFDIAGYEQALAQVDVFWNENEARGNATWQVEGPNNIGARINTVAIDSKNENVMYIGFSDGGVWKTTDKAKTWTPIFDAQNFLSIADIEIDPNNSNTLYVATGDPNISGYPSIGDGLYKSTDAGKTWKNIGLSQTRILSKIRVNHQNSNIVYAGAMGVPFIKTADRGFYKSNDGGTTWKKTLFVSDSTGVIDMVVNPQNANIVYVATWDRIRNDKVSVVSGFGARIYKSTDAGENWSLLNAGLPQGKFSRIGLSMAPSDPNTVYSVYVGQDLAINSIYKTTNAGVKWDSVATFAKKLPTDVLRNFGWYFGKIAVHPTNPDDIFLLGVDLWRKKSATADWEMATPDWFFYEVHADKHDLVFTKNNSLILATDGGLYRSDDNAQSWADIENIPCTQFYRVETSPLRVGEYYGGAQDNGTTGGNKTTDEWPRLWGGDGFQARFHPTDPNIYFYESQNGSIYGTFDDGDNFFPASDAIDETDRRSWDMPYFLSKYDPTKMYSGTFRAYKGYYDPTTKDTPLWDPISPDLTKGNIYGDRFHNITTIEESPDVKGLIYVGTSDGNVWRTDNDGVKWEKINIGLPDRYVTKILPLKNGEVIVTFSGYRSNDFTPHIFLSSNKGLTWKSIAGNMPNIAINDVCVVPINNSKSKYKIAVATDAGVYETFYANYTWNVMGSGMPKIKVYSIIYDNATKNFVAGTFARSLMTLPYTPNTTSVVTPSIAGANIFPTVTSDFFTIKSEKEEIVSVDIYDLQGKLMWSEKNNFLEKNITVNNLPSGMYVVKVKAKNNQCMVKKLIKK